MTKVYFIRHGQSTANLTKCFAGHLDLPLTDLGRQQAECTAKFLANIPLSAVYSSDLARAYDTAVAVAGRHRLTVQTDRDLREIFAGEWEGRCFDELNESDAAYRHWVEDIGTAVCTNGESVAQMFTRVHDAVERIVAKHPNESVCIVCHGTPIRALTCVLSGIPLKQMHTVPWASNASVTIAEFSSANEEKIISADLHEHLGSLSSSLPANV